MSQMDILDGLQRQINGLQRAVEDLQTQEFATGWIDYSATSTLTGWASTTTKKIYYKKVGKIVFVNFKIEGTAHGSINTASFTLPFSNGGGANSQVYTYVRAMDNGAWQTAGLGELNPGSSQFNLYPQAGGGTWTTGAVNKRVYGQFWYLAS